jgi:hypothetical protein
MRGRIIDPSEREDDGPFDASDLECPNCGCNDVDVRRLPVAGRWFGGQGEAVCRHCGCLFKIKAET